MNFQLRGYRVLTAADGEEGMRLAFDERPDLIVLDLMLPGLDGFEILGQLREQEVDVPVLILSARGQVDGQGGRLPARRRRLRHQALPAPRADRPGGGHAAPPAPQRAAPGADRLRRGRDRSARSARCSRAGGR